MPHVVSPALRRFLRDAAFTPTLAKDQLARVERDTVERHVQEGGHAC